MSHIGEENADPQSGLFLTGDLRERDIRHQLSPVALHGTSLVPDSQDNPHHNRRGKDVYRGWIPSCQALLGASGRWREHRGWELKIRVSVVRFRPWAPSKFRPSSVSPPRAPQRPYLRQSTPPECRRGRSKSVGW